MWAGGLGESSFRIKESKRRVRRGGGEWPFEGAAVLGQKEIHPVQNGGSKYENRIWMGPEAGVGQCMRLGWRGRHLRWL